MEAGAVHARAAKCWSRPATPAPRAKRKCRNVAVAATDIDGLLRLVREEAVGLTVVGPEAPLVAGVVDAFRAAGLRIFGPTAAAAQLEGSKAYAKDFLARHGIPTAHYAVFETAGAGAGAPARRSARRS